MKLVNLRSSNPRHPVPRTTSYQSSFISATELWNDVDPQLKTATSLYSFKQTLKKQVSQPPKYYTHTDRTSNILLCQLRNGKSQLNSYLHRDQILESANCSQCMVLETSKHFLFNCSKYNTQRVALMNWLISQPGIYQTIAINKIDL